MDIEKKKCTIMPLSPIKLQNLQNFINVDNVFRGLIKQEQQVKMNLDGAKRFLHDAKKNRNMLNDFLVPVGNGMLKKLSSPHAQKEYIANINKNIQTIENQYAGILEQHSHKSDDYGEALVLLYKNLASTLKYYYNFNDESLTYLLHDRKNATKVERTKEEINEDIKKALEE